MSASPAGYCPRLKALVALLLTSTMLGTPSWAEGARRLQIKCEGPSGKDIGVVCAPAQPSRRAPVADPAALDADVTPVVKVAGGPAESSGSQRGGKLNVPSLTYPSTKEECAANKAKIESAIRDALPPAEAEAFMAKSQAFEYASLACEQEEFQLAVINGRLVLRALQDKLNPKPPQAPKVVDPECGKYWIEDCGDEPGVDEPQPSGGCFVTTACCQIVGLSDDCFELRILRRYRDRVLSRTPDGQRDVERYYAAAPAILDSMRGEGYERELLTLYFTHILPSALLASLGFDRAARRIYTHMMDGLTRRHHSSL